MSELGVRQALRGREALSKREIGASHVTRLSDSLILLVGPFEGMEGQRVEVMAEVQGRPLRLEAHGLSYARKHDGTAGLIVARFPRGAVRSPNWAPLRVVTDDSEVTLSPDALAETDVRTLLRAELASLPVDVRNDLMEFLVNSIATKDAPEAYSLSKELHLIREALRERLPFCVISAEEPRGFQLDDIYAIDDTLFWVKGWLRDDDDQSKLMLVSPEGARTNAVTNAFRYLRPDVVQFYAGLGIRNPRQKLGFITHIELEAPSHLAGGWIGELHSSSGPALEVPGPDVIRDPGAIRDAILADLSQEKPIGGPLTVGHVRPALTRLQEATQSMAAVHDVQSYGKPPRSPDVTIVVPLYQRIDFVEHQLLQFSRDPDFTDADLVYVLDSPELADSLAHMARELFALYGVPFRVVTMTANAGFAGANNAGASVARGKLLLLLNSDVIPDRPGWLSKMMDFYAATPQIGALAPKLLYEDDSLQHAGLYFYRPPGSEVWENAHCFKGLHRSLPAANVARQVPAVTAACMMVDRDLYESLDGLAGHYIRGDYEDSEFCLRLLAKGLYNWYMPQAELYHLEAQSYTPELRRSASEYNMWLHTHLWGHEINRVMADFHPHDVAAPDPRP